MSLLILLLSLLCAVKAIRDMFLSRPSALWLAWASLIAVRLSELNVPLWSTVIFWGVASAIVLAIGYMLPREVSESRVGLGYFGVGAIAGAAVGYVVSPSEAGLIIGAVIATLIGAVAFSRTPAGKPLVAPVRRYANYVLAKGMYVIVTVDVIALTVINLVQLAKTL